jgi:predicted nucleic acid-binding protein
LIYLDTSAIVKLVRPEPLTEALLDHLGQYPSALLVTSVLSTVETARALVRSGAPELAEQAVRGCDRIDIDGAAIPTIAMSEEVLGLARSLPPSVLRSLDAIHVATALLVGPGLRHLVTYDKRMVAAAEAAGLRTAAPS